MSYNGIGLQTPRGTGTSGHVQRNVANKHSEGFREKRQREAAEEQRREVRARVQKARLVAGAEVRDHDRKRRVEVKCMELRERLEDAGVAEADIEEKVQKLRADLGRDERGGEVAASESADSESDKSKSEVSKSEKPKGVDSESDKSKGEDLKSEDSKSAESKGEDSKSEEPKRDAAKDGAPPQDSANTEPSSKEKRERLHDSASKDGSTPYKYVPRYKDR